MPRHITAIESQMPIQPFSQFSVRFPRDAVMPKAELRELIGTHRCKLASLTYRLASEGKYFEYRGVLSTLEESNVRELSETLRIKPAVIEFRLASTAS